MPTPSDVYPLLVWLEALGAAPHRTALGAPAQSWLGHQATQPGQPPGGRGRARALDDDRPALGLGPRPARRGRARAAPLGRRQPAARGRAPRAPECADAPPPTGTCPLLWASILGQLGGAVQAPLAVLVLARELGLAPTALGVVFAAAGVGAVMGSFLARPAAAWLGPGRAVPVGTLFSATGMLLLPLAAGPPPLVLATPVVGQFLFGVGYRSTRSTRSPSGSSRCPTTCRGAPTRAAAS